MLKARVGLCLLLLIAFACSFAASAHNAMADDEGLCPCQFWCDCEGSVVGGDWFDLPGGEKECRSSQTNLNCLCAVCQ